MIKTTAERHHDFSEGTARYRIYEDGRIFSYYFNRFLIHETDFDGYHVNTLGGKKKKIHRLVLTYFDRPPKGREITRHLDGVKTNNHISNLRWGTFEENWNDNRRLGVASVREKHGRAKLNWPIINSIRRIFHENYSISEYQLEHRLAGFYNVSPSLINKIKLNQIWEK
jgi:hypothetical protein